MKKLFKYSILLIMAATFTGCWEKDELNPSRESAIEAVEDCGPMEVDFLAGQNIHAGTISVSDDATNLYVTFNTADGWNLEETHLYVGSMESLPKTGNGNPMIGLFPYKTEFSPTATTTTYTIPLSSLGEDQCFVVAAHASVVTLDSEDNVVSQETAWGAGNRLTPRGNWATYFTYCVCDGDTGGGEGIIGGN